MDTVDFPTRMQRTSVSIIDNIFIDYSRRNNYSIFPCYNGLSDHDDQLITLYNTINSQPMSNSYVIRKINQTTLVEFNFKLRFEAWEGIFSCKDINVAFNIFLNQILRLFL
jgi:hypothetical protein